MAQLTDDCFAFSGPLLPIADMERLIAERVQPVAESETVALSAARGRVLTADVSAPLDLPPFDNSAVDGYAVHHRDLDGKAETRLFAFNVPPEEGDLKLLSGEQLADRLRGVRFEYQRAEDFQFDPTAQSGFNLGQAVLYFLVILLIGEQLLAYSISYHPPVARGAV